MVTLDKTQIPYATDSSDYVPIGPDSDCWNPELSVTGKAVSVGGRRATSHKAGQICYESFWVPVSIIRKVDDGAYGVELCVPSWFVTKNNLWHHFN